MRVFGGLGDDAVEKTSNNGRPYLRLRIRVGEGDQRQWLSALVFDDEAVATSRSLVKGTRVYIEGSIRLDEWDDKDGSKKHGLLVISNFCRLAQIGRQKARDDNGHRQAAAGHRDNVRRSASVVDVEDPIPF